MSVLGPVWENMKTAVENLQVISEYSDVERKQGVLLGPFEWSKVPEFHLSVYDGISGELCSLQYMRMEEVVRRLLKLGPGAQMACAWRR